MLFRSESLKLLAEGLAATLQSAKLSTAGAKESAKAVSEFIGVLSILKSTLPGNTLQIKIRGDIDENLVKTIDKLAIDFRDINNLSLQTNSDKLADAIDKANAKQISVSGITELQKIIKDLNMVEIDLLTEQRDILKDVRTTLRESNIHLQALTAGGANISTPMGSKSYIREERSSTREHYLQNTNLFKSTIK